MACVALEPRHRATVEGLGAFSRRVPGQYKTPKVIKLVRDLPKGPSGKVRRLKVLEI